MGVLHFTDLPGQIKQVKRATCPNPRETLAFCPLWHVCWHTPCLADLIVTLLPLRDLLFAIRGSCRWNALAQRDWLCVSAHKQKDTHTDSHTQRHNSRARLHTCLAQVPCHSRLLVCLSETFWQQSCYQGHFQEPNHNKGNPN